ncbi:MAG: AEC family transporter [Roseiflexus sp.]|nr:AEC family transporter [Roseiflexus sp.]MCS7288581.1 AEC family transporter [Roseiflexus sp.]MDW8232038.1 AEC family transporter [Roseiflexaceae bacterium]
MPALLSIFLDVLAPVFLLVSFGYIAGPRLNLESRTLTRFSYFILIPAFTFDVMSNARIGAALAGQMVAYTVVVHLGCAGVGYIIATLLRRSPKMVAAYVLIAIFGNVGNFGIPIIQFRFPGSDQALVAGTVYFLAISSIAFVVGVAAANWHRGGAWRAALAVVKTPALIAVPPALMVNSLQIGLPPLLARSISLLSAAMIPTMLVALGVQLSGAGMPRLTLDALLAAAVRLIGGPALALLLAPLFGLDGIERAVGILQAAMPAAVLASIIAVENDLLPEFVITTVLFSTLLSIVTLTIVLAIV